MTKTEHAAASNGMASRADLNAALEMLARAMGVLQTGRDLHGYAENSVPTALLREWQTVHPNAEKA